MSRVCELTKLAMAVKIAAATEPIYTYAPDPSRYGAEKPLEKIIQTAMQFIGPAGMLPSFLSGPAEIIQTILIDKFFNKLKGRRISDKAFSEGYNIGVNNPFLRFSHPLGGRDA